MNYPKISIVTPSFNQAAFIEETINSVLDQNYPNLEYIVIDGGSTDNSVDIIRKYEKHLKFWISEKDNGMYDAVNKGFQKSSGEIMAWINSDDKYYFGALSVVADFFLNFPEVNWMQGNPSEIDENGRIINVFTSRKWSKYNFYLGDYKYIQQESTFWRRSLWEKSGSMLRPDLKYAGDFELWLRFFEYEKLYCLRTVIGQFRHRSSNQFSIDKLDDYHREAEILIKDKLKKISSAERKILDRIVLLKNKQSIFSYRQQSFQREVNQLMDYPPNVFYSRLEKKFKIANV